eukprot:maker-scaffold535_size144686-snap-gene-0.21 protein:Tk08729 transcript:maker-scaffold535_size144686-snap-gene-0.21-mRNA-1 annotation:"hypothetical protein CAPTEDRAFT_166167"
MEPKPKRPILITGGSGYLGYHIGLDLFEKDYQVILFDKNPPLTRWKSYYFQKHAPNIDEDLFESKLKHVQGDICDFSTLRDVLISHSVGGVIHCASFGLSGNENLPAFDDIMDQVNIGGSRSVLRACSEAGVEALVYTSTVNVVFNGQVVIRKGTEVDLPYLGLQHHTDHYSRTKQVAEEFILTASDRLLAQVDGGSKVLRTCALRLNGIYGPNEHRHLKRTIQTIKKGFFVAGYCYDTKQDMIHIDNAVQGHVKALMALLDPTQSETLSGQAYFITDGHPVNNLKFFGENLVPAILGQDAKMPEYQIPFWIMILMGWMYWALSKVLGLTFRLPPWGITLTEAYKTGVSHYFSVDKAKDHFGYVPLVRWDQKSWDEILRSFNLARPIVKKRPT